MKTYTIYLLLLLCTGFFLPSYAQEDLRIKDNNGNTLMEVREEGVLIRRLSTAERTTINLTAADNGLLVYDTDTKSFWTWKDAAWTELDSDATNELELPVNPAPGTMAYYNGSDWVTVAPGPYGAFLTFCDGVPSWGGCLPKVITNPDITTTGLNLFIKGEVISDGGSALTARGFVWSDAPNPTMADNVYLDNSLVTLNWNGEPNNIPGVGFELMSFPIISEAFSTTYYVRAFATNSIGTAYGNEISVTTISEDPHDVVLPNNDIIQVYPTLIQSSNWGPFGQNIAGLTDYATENEAVMDYNGEGNTMAIVNELANYNNDSYAAKRCADLVSGDGKDDWYLPAAGEMKAIAEQLGALGFIINGLSSSERDANSIWYVTNYNNVTINPFSKGSNGCWCARRD